MYKVFIGNNYETELDTDNATNISVRREVFKIEHLAKPKTFSYTIKFPPTDKNKLAFKFADSPQSSNGGVYVAEKCMVYKDGVSLFSGMIYKLGASNYIECSIKVLDVDNLIDEIKADGELINTLGDYAVYQPYYEFHDEDFDSGYPNVGWFKYCHIVGNDTNVTTPQTGLLFPETIRPLVKGTFILGKIANKHGFTEFEFEDSAKENFFDKVYVFPNGNKNVVENNEAYYEFVFQGKAGSPSVHIQEYGRMLAHDYEINRNSYYFKWRKENLIQEDGSVRSPMFVEAKVSHTADLTIDLVSGTKATYLWCQHYRGDTLINTFPISGFPQVENNVDLLKGDTLHFLAEYTSTSGAFNVSLSIDSGILNTNETNEIVFPENIFAPITNLPDISIKDFVESVCKLTGTRAIGVGDKIVFKDLFKYIKTPNDYNDLSKWFIDVADISFDYSKILARNSWFKFENKKLGNFDYNKITANDNYEETKDVVSNKFGGAKDTESEYFYWQNGVTIPHHEFIATEIFASAITSVDDDDAKVPYNYAESYVDVGALFLWNEMNMVFNAIMFDGKLDGETIYNTHYAELDKLKNKRVKKIYTNVPSLFWKNMNKEKLCFFQQTGKKYLILEVLEKSDYQELTVIECS